MRVRGSPKHDRSGNPISQRAPREDVVRVEIAFKLSGEAYQRMDALFRRGYSLARIVGIGLYHASIAEKFPDTEAKERDRMTKIKKKRCERCGELIPDAKEYRHPCAADSKVVTTGTITISDPAVTFGVEGVAVEKVINEIRTSMSTPPGGPLSDESARSLAQGLEDVAHGRVQPLDPSTLSDGSPVVEANDADDHNFGGGGASGDYGAPSAPDTSAPDTGNSGGSFGP